VPREEPLPAVGREVRALTPTGWAIVAVAILASLLFWANEGRCVWCPTYPCYSSANCGQCECLKTGNSMQGVCVSLK